MARTVHNVAWPSVRVEKKRLGIDVDNAEGLHSLQQCQYSPLWRRAMHFGLNPYAMLCQISVVRDLLYFAL